MCMIKSWKSLPKAISPNHLFRWAWVKYISHGSHQKRKLSSWRNIQGARKLPIHQSLVAHKLQCKYLWYWQLNAYRFKRFGEFGQHLLHELYCTSFDSYSLASGLLPVWPPHLPVSGWAWEMFSLWNLSSLSRGKFWWETLYLHVIDTKLLFTVLFREQSSIDSAPIVTFNMDSRPALSRLRTTGCSRVFHRHAGRSSSPLQVLWSIVFFFLF